MDSSFDLYPAIDLIDGRAVRLLHGQFDQRIESELDDALARADMVWAAGARALHVIDLDAARTGAPAEPNAGLIARIARERPPGTLLQVGGGLRSVESIELLLAAGVDRVLIGTMALREPERMRALIERHGTAIAVALDSRDRMVRVAGWTEDAGLEIGAAAAQMAEIGVGMLLITGIDRDGTLSGPDLALLGRVREAAPDVGVIAAGGVTTPADVEAVRAAGCAGAVVGRALLDDPSAITALLHAAR